jgi:carbon monoxide dehydrogenase subunit G
MHLDGTYTFKARRQQVWDTLQNPTTISQCMPGCERFEQIGEDRYEATMKIGIGPIRGTYTGRVHLRDRTEPERYVMEVEGGGGPGHMKGAGTLTLAEQDGQTVVSYDGDAQVTGKIASVGQRLLGVSAKQLIGQFFKCMERKLDNGAA